MPVTTTVPTVASYTGGVPRLSNVSTFDTDMDNFLPFLGTTLPAAVQNWTTAVNQVAGQINSTASAAATSESNAAQSATNAAGSATTAVNYAIKVDGYASGTDNSAKSWAVGGTGTGQPSLGDAKSWASKVGSVVVTGEYSAKEWAIGTTVPSGSAMEWAAMAPGTPVNGSEYSAKHYAQSALNAPGTGATSTTSLAIGTGSKALTIQAGKAYSIGQWLIVASTASPSNWLSGQITAYNSTTGSLTVDVTAVGGSGTFAAWTVSLTAAGVFKTINGQAITGSGAITVIANYSYDNRGSLRSLSPQPGEHASVDGLGLFVWESGSTEPDDDESCFATTNGRWLMEAAHWDVVDSWQLPDREAVDEDLETLRAVDVSQQAAIDLQKANWPGKLLFGTAASSITSVGSLATTTFAGTIAGAAVGDRVIATPPAQLDARISFYALVTATNTVTVYLNNASASTASLTAGTWNLAVLDPVL